MPATTLAQASIDLQSIHRIANMPDPVASLDGANKQYVLAQIAAAALGFLEYKGMVDASANPNYPPGVVGDFYLVSVAGKLGGASGATVDAGDWVVCSINNGGSTQAAVGADWGIADVNRNQATTAVLGVVALAVAADIDTGTNALKAITPLALAQAAFRQRFTQLVGDGVVSSFTFTHGFTTRNFRVSLIRQISPFDVVTLHAITFPSTTTVTLDFAPAVPASSEYQLVLEPIV